MILTKQQEALLESIEATRAEEKAWVEQFEIDKKQEKARGRAHFRQRLTEGIADSLKRDIPKRRIALAYGTQVFANIPVGKEAVIEYEKFREQVLAGTAQAPPPTRKTPQGRVEEPAPGEEATAFDVAQVQFTLKIDSNTNVEADFGANCWVEDWEVIDPSGMVTHAQVYGAMDDEDDWDISFTTADGVNAEQEVDVLSKTIKGTDVLRQSWLDASI